MDAGTYRRAFTRDPDESTALAVTFGNGPTGVLAWEDRQLHALMED
jgi:hypothetical protein